RFLKASLRSKLSPIASSQNSEPRRCALSEPSAAAPQTPLGRRSGSASWRRLSNPRSRKRHVRAWLGSRCKTFAIPDEGLVSLFPHFGLLPGGGFCPIRGGATGAEHRS